MEKSLEDPKIMDHTPATTAAPSQHGSEGVLESDKALERRSESTLPPALSRSPSPNEKVREPELVANEVSPNLAEEKPTPMTEEEDTTNHVQGFKLAVVVIALCLAVFLVALVSLLNRSRWG